jgi:oxygen-independent coproporphyrinogen III oxidase
MQTITDKALLSRYDQPVPRYTSYPTVPFWKDGLDGVKWADTFTTQFNLHNKKEGISLYLHLPFCESLCTYCGCNKKITTNHGVEDEYLNVLMKEWTLYRQRMGEAPVIRELHLGGGTPTFFSPDNLKRLLAGIYKDAELHREREFSFEGHPNNTTREHLDALYEMGFRRVSYGVQDNDPEVQRVINRIQPLENVQRAVDQAREAGYLSVNFDLIYGLPLQDTTRMRRTIEQSISLGPDRIAFYSYAHVPWTSRGQRLFDEKDLPSAEMKMELLQLGREMFADHGYLDIGMDHFALPTDDLSLAWQEGRLHRNFMGYTTQRTALLLGLGVSSISDAGIAFAQNEKTIHDYYRRVELGEVPVFRGHFLNEEDSTFRRHILNISCQGRTRFSPDDLPLLRASTFPELENLKADGLLDWNEEGLLVTPKGRLFIRNICAAFDLHLIRNRNGAAAGKFSKAI